MTPAGREKMAAPGEDFVAVLHCMVVLLSTSTGLGVRKCGKLLRLKDGPVIVVFAECMDSIEFAPIRDSDLGSEPLWNADFKLSPISPWVSREMVGGANRTAVRWLNLRVALYSIVAQQHHIDRRGRLGKRTGKGRHEAWQGDLES